MLSQLGGEAKESVFWRRPGRHRAANREAWWAADTAVTPGLALPVREWRRQVVFLKRPSDLSEPDPAVIEDSHLPYFRYETGQLTLVGPEDANRVGVDPDSYGESIDTGFVLNVGECLA
jgi:hypothetical protein